MRKWMSTICILLGAALVISALLLLGYNRMEDKQAGAAADAAMEQIRQMMEANRQHNSGEEEQGEGQLEKGQYEKGSEPNSDSEADDSEPASGSTDENIIGGTQKTAADYEYIGILSIPSLERELPVMAECDYTRLKIAPCRQYGSAENDDLIIAAHNYDRHFGKLSKLKDGDSVIFTDMDGETYEYAVREVKVAEPTVEEVINSDWELILYTCTYGGKTRVVVGCERLE